jgi:nucleoside-diphosphate-sugar epimerase
MRVLILGGTLFIGRRIALELLARGDDVTVVSASRTSLFAYQCGDRWFSARWIRAWRWIRGTIVHPINRQAFFHHDLFGESFS